MNIYPALKFHNIYLLGGGYSSFVSQFQAKCSDNGGYIKMTDKKYQQVLSDLFDERKNMRTVGLSVSTTQKSISNSSSDFGVSPLVKRSGWTIFKKVLSGAK